MLFVRVITISSAVSHEMCSGDAQPDKLKVDCIKGIFFKALSLLHICGNCCENLVCSPYSILEG